MIKNTYKAVEEQVMQYLWELEKVSKKIFRTFSRTVKPIPNIVPPF